MLYFKDISQEQVLVEAIEDENTKIKKWFFEGITAQGDIKNHNGRIYPFNVLKESIGSYINSFMNKNRAVGELNHPTENAAQINPANISHKFVRVQESGKNFVTRAQILDTPPGKIVQNLLEGGVQLATSTRGLGDIKESGGAKIVTEYQFITLGDIVFDPSGPDCFVQGLMENKEYIYENGILVCKDMDQVIDEYKKTIQEAKREDIRKVMNIIFEDYLKKFKA